MKRNILPHRPKVEARGESQPRLADPERGKSLPLGARAIRMNSGESKKKKRANFNETIAEIKPARTGGMERRGGKKKRNEKKKIKF